MPSAKVSLNLPNPAKFEDSTTQDSDELFITLPPSGETDNLGNYSVDFDGPDDQSNPINWPLWYKWTLIVVLSSVNTIANLATVLCLPAAPQILRDFHTENTTLYITIIASIWELGEAVAALLTAPLSEIFGRAPVYNVTNTMFVIFSIASGLSTSPGMLIGFRFLNGMGDASISLNASIAGDLFIQEERGLPIAILSFPPLLGPVFGPVIGGYLTQGAGWRWAFWFSAITGGVFELAFFFTFRETYTPQILRKKAQKLRKETGNVRYRSRFDFDTRVSGMKILKDGLVRPAMLFCEPVVFILSVQVSIAYGYMYILFTTLTPVFEKTYHFSQGAAGLAFLGLSIGMVLGVTVCALTLDKLLKRYTTSSGVFKPEIRLLPMAVGCALFPLGLFLYGWSASFRLFYIIPMIGTATVGLGYFITNIPLQAYLVDVYHEYAASAVGATVVLRCIFATVLPLGALPLYNRLGLGWGNSVLGFIAVLFIPVPLLLVRFGERLRRKYRSDMEDHITVLDL